jgi:hypothetical protein
VVACFPRAPVPDGIIYPSRLNGHTNIAVFGHAVSKLAPARVVPLIGASGLAAVINDLHVMRSRRSQTSALLTCVSFKPENLALEPGAT